MTHAGNPAAHGAFKRTALLAALGIVLAGLPGCGTDSLFSNSQPQAGLTTPAAADQQTAMISFATILGAPADVSGKLSSALVAEAVNRKISVATTASDTPEYTVRGFVHASPDNASTKLAYVWDVFNRTGQQVHRIEGEEIVQGNNPANPWAVFNDAAIQTVSAKVVQKVALWVPKKDPPAVQQGALVASAQPQGGQATSAQAGTASSVAPSAAGAPQQAVATANAGTAAAQAQPASLATTRTATRTAAAPASYAALVPEVTGAPGDGNASLAEAIRRQLTAKGIRLTKAQANNAYRVQGTVGLGAPVSGSQEIKIEWAVIDPAGKRVGRVSQATKIKQGSLDGPWGRIADAAAVRAVDPIVKLLPKETAMN